MTLPLEEQQTALAEVQLHDFRAHSLRSLVVSHLAQGSVIDVGCGGGGMVHHLLSGGRDAHGIDTSDEIIAAAQTFLRKHGCDPQRVSKTPIAELVAAGHLVDNVISMDCLEHVEDDSVMFQSLVALLRPGGRLVVTVPAVPALYGERDRLIGHYRRYTPGRLRLLSSRSPLRVEELRYWNVLGVAPVFVYARLLGQATNESFRYGEASLPKQALRRALSLWFHRVENRIKPPLGLTLFLVATKT